jgi:hypothetical protein
MAVSRGRGGIRIPIITEFDDKAIKDFAGSIEKLGKGFTKNLTVPIAAVGGAFAFFIKGAIEAERQQQRLTQILKTTSLATDEQIDLLLKQAEALEKTTVVSKENVVATQAQLATFDLQASTIAKLTPAILDYVTAEKGAAASTDDFKSMTNSLAQALNGQFGGLTRVGFVLDDNTKKLISNGTESERAAAIVSVLNSTYEGFAESLANTPEGQLIKLQQEFGSLKDEIGKALLPVMADVIAIIRNDLAPLAVTAAGFIKSLADRFAELDDNTKKQVFAFILMLAAIGPVLIIISKLIKAILVLAGVFALLTKAIILIPLVILTLISVFRAQSDAQYQLARETGDTWTAIAVVIEKAVHSILFVVEGVINGFQVMGLAYTHLGQLIEGGALFGGSSQVSMMTFKERLRDLVRHEFVDLTSGTENIADSILGLGQTFSDIQTDVTDFESAQKAAGLSAAELEAQIAALQTGVETAGGANEKAAEKTTKLKEAIQALKNEMVKIKTVAVDALKSSLSDAEKKLDEARNKFNQFKDAITGSITGVIDFGKAAENENFLAGLTEQAENAKTFADRVKTLIQLGLSEAAIQEILKAGNEAGVSIADQIIAGGSTVVDQVNTLISSVSAVAEQVGIAGAQEFFQAGMDQGQALVNGILEALRQAQAELAAAVKAAAAGGDIRTFGARATTLLDSIGGIKGSKKQANAMAAFEQALAGSGKISKKEDAAIRARFKLAKGGIVMGPTNALIGEAGPEAVIPLSGANSARGAMGTTINITVNAGIGTDGTLVGRQIVESIKRYERSSGPVFARA